MVDGVGLDLTLLHYYLRDRKFALEISKEVSEEFLDEKVQLFFSILNNNFLDPDIKEVLSLNALLDYADVNGFSEHKVRFNNIYQKAKNFKIAGQEPEESDFRYYLKKIKERRNIQIVKESMGTLTDLLAGQPTAEEVNKVLGITLKDINALNQIQIFDEGTVGEDAQNMLDEYEAIAANPIGMRGVTVGFPSLDNRTNGFQKAELIIICGMEGSGKSILLQNMGVNAWLGSNTIDSDEIVENGHNVLYFTLEMPRSNRGEPTMGAYLNKRILSTITQLPFNEIKSGTLSPENKERLIKGVEFIKKYEQYYKFHVVDIPRGATVQNIESKYLEVSESMDVDIVIVDYLGIMSAGLEVPDHLAQGHISEGLHELARTYNFPCLTAAQLNRPSGGKGQSLNNQSYNNTRLARSAMIGQNANIVMMIETRDDEHIERDMKVHITKFRDGEKGKLVFTKNFACMSVSDGAPFSSYDSEMHDFMDEPDDC